MKFVALALLACLGGAPQALAGEIAPGVTFDVLKEHDASLIPGVTKIVESILIMQPGAKLNMPKGTESMNICTAMLGQVTVTMGGKTVVRRAGDQWTEPKETPMFLHNTGKIPYVDKTFQIFFK